MKRTAVAMMLVLSFLLATVAGVRFVVSVGANPVAGMTPAPTMPTITIGSDGNVNPANASIGKAGSVYTLTGNITNYALDIKCDNVTLDGAGFTILKDSSSVIYAPSCGITIYSDGVIVKNLNIDHHDTAITVFGSHNVVARVNVGSSVKIEGNYNEMIGNVFPDSYLIVEGNYNTIKGNVLRVRGVVMRGNYNTAVANTLEECTNFAVMPSNGTNFFYLNNFINNTYIGASLNNSLNQEMFAKLDLAKLPQTHISPLLWQMIPNGWRAIYPDNTVFDNGSLGNYWSDYSGTDADHDGIGDTPYVIGGNLQDRYPLMAPVDISNVDLSSPSLQTLQEPSLTPSQEPQQAPGASPTLASPENQETTTTQPFPTALVITVIGASAAVVGVSLLMYLKRRNVE